MKLLLVDGSNLVMRAAFGGDIEPKFAVPTATGLIRRAAETCAATHLVVALDCPHEPTWRKKVFPEYKAHRTRDTGPWFIEAHAQWSKLGWYVEGVGGFEADDLIATLAHRAKARAEVVVCSGDSDLLTLTADGFAVLKPVNGGKFQTLHAPDVCVRYQLKDAARLRDFKALTGEDGDNIPGVPGIGPVRAAELLQEHGTIEGVLAYRGRDKHAVKVQQHAELVRHAYELVGLRINAPCLPLKPCDCRYAHAPLPADHEPQ